MKRYYSLFMKSSDFEKIINDFHFQTVFIEEKQNPPPLPIKINKINSTADTSSIREENLDKWLSDTDVKLENVNWLDKVKKLFLKT